jgi:hypothetical protein
MENKSRGEEKTIWAKIIKENMVRVDGSQSVYRLNDKKNKSVEIQLLTRNLVAHPQRPGRPPKIEAPVGQRNVTLDVSRADFLIVSRHSTVMKYKQYIPWNKIVEIVFRDD